ncbi:MAG: hypothetical protein H0X41_07005 [Chitinophagaceae bacterium]|nr:hypothetical protein [Chitinophagaceae bacterium]
MKRIILAAGLGLGILSFTMAGAANHPTAPVSHQLKYDTVPGDTTSPTPKPDTTKVH